MASAGADRTVQVSCGWAKASRNATTHGRYGTCRYNGTSRPRRYTFCTRLIPCKAFNGDPVTRLSWRSSLPRNRLLLRRSIPVSALHRKAPKVVRRKSTMKRI